MITVRRFGTGFKLSFTSGKDATAIREQAEQRGLTVKAKSVDEIHLAIDHYYQHGGVKMTLSCPLCRVEKKRQEKSDAETFR